MKSSAAFCWTEAKLSLLNTVTVYFLSSLKWQNNHMDLQKTHVSHWSEGDRTEIYRILFYTLAFLQQLLLSLVFVFRLAHFLFRLFLHPFKIKKLDFFTQLSWRPNICRSRSKHTYSDGTESISCNTSSDRSFRFWWKQMFSFIHFLEKWKTKLLPLWEQS